MYDNNDLFSPSPSSINIVHKRSTDTHTHAGRQKEGQLALFYASNSMNRIK